VNTEQRMPVGAGGIAEVRLQYKRIKQQMLAALHHLSVLPDRQEQIAFFAGVLATAAVNSIYWKLSRNQRKETIPAQRVRLVAFEKSCLRLSKMIGGFPVEAFRQLDAEMGTRLWLDAIRVAATDNSYNSRLLQFAAQLHEFAAAARRANTALDSTRVVVSPDGVEELTQAARHTYKHLTGLPATRRTMPESGQAYGPFVSFLAEVFAAAGTEASPEWYSRSLAWRTKRKKALREHAKERRAV
jgi:hypothetical protein